MTVTNHRKRNHTDADLRTGSDYLEYHVRMYIETLLWLRDQHESGKPEGTLWNAVLEAYLVHARILIDFLYKSNSRYDDDVIAVHYFHDLPVSFNPLPNTDLEDWAKEIGGRLVHITTKPMPALKSQQKWPIDDIASGLIPTLMDFLKVVPDALLADGVREDCKNHLSKVPSPIKPLSVHATT